MDNIYAFYDSSDNELVGYGYDEAYECWKNGYRDKSDFKAIKVPKPIASFAIDDMESNCYKEMMIVGNTLLSFGEYEMLSLSYSESYNGEVFLFVGNLLKPLLNVKFENNGESETVFNGLRIIADAIGDNHLWRDYRISTAKTDEEELDLLKEYDVEYDGEYYFTDVMALRVLNQI